MNWNELLTPQRTGQPVEKTNHNRTEFQRDYDRLIFSAPFRRMQNKTQVFPLPGAIFVHNRLTHSLEVSSVGRSLGNNIARKIVESGEAQGNEYVEEIGSIVASACLAHDMGNPPFGHSGESAISHYFTNGEGRGYLDGLTEAEKGDLINFDGNANTFRILTHSFKGRRDGGFALTLPTVASIVKYPRASVGVKKFGYFQQDKEAFEHVMQSLNVSKSENGEYVRYPLVYLVEAADDICYQVMDVEDAYRLGILSYDETRELLMSFFDKETEVHVYDNLEKVCRTVTDKHEQVAYMRSIVIGKLVGICTETFWRNRESIMEGSYRNTLIKDLPETETRAMEIVKKLSFEQIYKHQSVVEIELSGFTIIGTLLDKFIKAIEEPDLYYSRLLKPFIPEQFQVAKDATMYDKLISAVDLVAGMTDLYALDLFKKIKGTI
ncbi:MAG: dNTP triphosphohydrolase [Bacteroidales bacterium]|nr:dNTP triphosphohydrolase [Bacteroidales bacterium]